MLPNKCLLCDAGFPATDTTTISVWCDGQIKYLTYTSKKLGWYRKTCLGVCKFLHLNKWAVLLKKRWWNRV